MNVYIFLFFTDSERRECRLHVMVEALVPAVAVVEGVIGVIAATEIRAHVM